MASDLGVNKKKIKEKNYEFLLRIWKVLLVCGESI